uniref:Uncharacterized protein n=1 Tax=Anguilla anguilla TaxID=7936 RepID=A0A0E9TJQ8_ANGAN
MTSDSSNSALIPLLFILTHHEFYVCPGRCSTALNHNYGSVWF